MYITPVMTYHCVWLTPQTSNGDLRIAIIDWICHNSPTFSSLSHTLTRPPPPKKSLSATWCMKAYSLLIQLYMTPDLIYTDAIWPSCHHPFGPWLYGFNEFLLRCMSMSPGLSFGLKKKERKKLFLFSHCVSGTLKLLNSNIYWIYNSNWIVTDRFAAMMLGKRKWLIF